MGWTNPWVLAGLDRRRRAAGRVRASIETRVADPMFHLELFRIRAFAAGNLAGLLASIGRGGLQFMLIIWLQGIWLPLHGYSYESHAAVGRHLPAAADRRLPGRRPGRRAALSDRYRRRGRSPPAGCCWSRRRSSGCCCCPVDFAYPAVRRC